MSEHTLAVMQPYLFPYIGYFNLIQSVSNFVLYDDVNYIKQGWINRNRVLSSNGEITFSVPLSSPSSSKKINEVKILDFGQFKKKFRKTIEQSYGKSKYFHQGMEYVDGVLCCEVEKISQLAAISIKRAVQIFDMQCKIFESSCEFPQLNGLERTCRLIAMASQLDCSCYVNSINGSSLYDRDVFLQHDVELKFLRPKLMPYPQLHSREFIPSLSIIDMLMNLPIEEIKKHLRSYELIQCEK